MKTDPNPLHDALADLATTMSPNPYRLREVRQRVARRRRQRMAAGAAVSAGAVAAAVGIAMVPREPRTSLQFAAGGVPSLPTCASVPAPETVSPEKTVGPDDKAPEPDLVVRYKGTAVVMSLAPTSLTLGSFAEPGLAPPVDPTALIVDARTTIENDGASATLADLAVGQRVTFAASVDADGREHLDHIDFGLVADKTDTGVRATEGATGPAKGATVPAVRNGPASDGTVNGKAVIEAAPVDNELVVQASFGDPDLQPIRLALNESTRYFRYETACTGGELIAGRSLIFSAVAHADGTYTATELRTYD